MENTTSLSDLVPENITYQIVGNGGGGGMGGGGMGGMGGGLPPPVKIEKGKGELPPTVYMAMDIHPNPYLNGGGTDAEFSHNMVPSGGMGGGMGGGGGGRPQHPLPSRDIPQNTLSYMSDEQTVANYIPQKKLTKEFFDLDDTGIKNYKRKKYRKRILEDLLEELQIPLFVALLFFLFQLPFVSSSFQKFGFHYLPFLFETDGNINLYGMGVKAVLMGGIYYGFLKFTDFISLEE